MSAQINAALTQAIYMHTSHKHTTPTHHAPCKPHMCKFTVRIHDVFMYMLLVFAGCMMAIFMHSMCLFKYLHVALLQQGCKCAVYVHACGWHACMQCAACTCVWCAFMWHIGMPGRVYSASALHVAKLFYLFRIARAGIFPRSS